MLRVTEIFSSIQGESTHAGRPCTFVRLTGCPMRCSWCDSEYTFTGGDHFTIDSIVERVRELGCQLVEITGGEPLAQRESLDLIRRLCDHNHEVLIETGGYVTTEEVDSRAKIILDVKCPASGEAERNHWPNLNRLRPDKDEVKFVIADRDDWEFAKTIIAEYQLETRTKAILISPAWILVLERQSRARKAMNWGSCTYRMASELKLARNGPFRISLIILGSGSGWSRQSNI